MRPFNTDYKSHWFATLQPLQRAAGEKWGEAKTDAKEGVDKLSDAAGEAADAAGMKARQGLGKAEQGLEDAKYQVRAWRKLSEFSLSCCLIRPGASKLSPGVDNPR